NYDDTEIKTEIAKTTEQAALNRSTLGYQRKNLLENTGASKTQNGLTFTVNVDKSVTLNGSLQDGKKASVTLNNNVVLPRTTLKKTAGFLIAAFNKSSGAWVATIANTNSVTVDASNFDYDSYVYKASIERSNLSEYNDAVVYPMICSADITDTTYEPYRPSVEEYIANLEERITALESMNLTANSLNSSLNTAEISTTEGENYD
ncbi:MAG: hypothetical protein K2J47_06080, partial [Ruminococcus sp.]|nr:hypothetical protein [Ruminococcus sp.]